MTANERYRSGRTVVSAVPIALALAAFIPACGSEPNGPPGSDDVVTVRSGLTNLDIALHWAPINYQDVNENGGTGNNGYADMFTLFNNDGDWNGWNNWDTLGSSNPAWAYFTVAETSTHWFIGYSFFHERDWTDSSCCLDEHENDMEGELSIVRKDGTTYGSFEALMSISHGDWIIGRNAATASYLGRGRKSPYEVSNLRFEVSGEPNDSVARPMTWQAAEGHAMAPCDNQDRCGFGGNDSIRYVPNFLLAQTPTLPPGGQQITWKYRLKDMADADSLWAHRFDHNAQASWEAYRGDHSGGCGDGYYYAAVCTDNAAGTPWAASQGDSLLFADPAKVANDYLSGWDNADPNRALSLDYISNSMGTPHSWRQTWTPVAEGGQTDNAVAAAVFDGRMFVFAKAAGSGAQQVQMSTSAGADWTPFSAAGGGTNSETDSQPAAVTCNNKLYAVVKQGAGPQTTLRWNVKGSTSNPATGWGIWMAQTAPSTTLGVGLACRANKVYVLLKGSDTHIYFATINSSTWSAWTEMPGGGLTYSTPSGALDETTGDLVVVVRGTDALPWINRLCSTCGELGWTGWSQHPGWNYFSSHAALAWDSGPNVPAGVYMFTENSNNGRIDADVWTNGGWRGPSIVRGYQRTSFSPAVVRFNGTLYLFARGQYTDQHIWMTVGKSSKLLSDGKWTNQISTYDSAGPWRAVDSHTDSASNNYFDGHISGDYFAGFTTHTNTADYPWWEVDLGQSRIIEQINVWNRTDCCANRLREWSVWTSTDNVNWTEIFKDSRPQGAGQLTVVNGYSDLYNGTNAGRTSNVPAWIGRYVWIQINRTSEALHLGEVQVIGN